jgi:hypothetical protein
VYGRQSVDHAPATEAAVIQTCLAFTSSSALRAPPATDPGCRTRLAIRYSDWGRWSDRVDGGGTRNTTLTL